ncbi:MAG: DUF1707 domain-containing protein [Actinomycetota bacterium]|nr:DUF1707 domain-containing protein [Actinomycetota bacterium]
MTALPASQLRVGDIDRQQAAAALAEHYAAGRLDVDEYDGRVTASYAARTSADLARLFVDLPDTPGRPHEARRHRRSRRVPAMPMLALVLLALLVVPVLVLVAHVVPFFLFPLLWFWWGSRHRHAWR